jgi:hypothetical protein
MILNVVTNMQMVKACLRAHCDVVPACHNGTFACHNVGLGAQRLSSLLSGSHHPSLLSPPPDFHSLPSEFHNFSSEFPF